jgi:hypothetical protein
VGAHLRTLNNGPQKHESLFSSYEKAQREAEYEHSLTNLVDGPLAQEDRKRMIVVLHRLMGRFSSVELRDLGVEAGKKGRPARDESGRRPIGRHLL